MLWSFIPPLFLVVWLIGYTFHMNVFEELPYSNLNFKQVNHIKTVNSSPQKLALIIAISEYAPNTGWTKTSATHDVPLIRSALSKQGFDTENNMILLQNEQATKRGIMQAFNEIIEKAQKGSMVVIHYSGHGQQIMDANGDELDGYDEALVSYDAPMDIEKIRYTYKGEKHISDDELDDLTRKLRTKIGPQGNLLLLLDACHSGTATRGAAKVRGTHLKIAPPNYEPLVQSQTRDSWDAEEQIPSLSPFIVFSSTSAGELNYEYEVEDASGMMVGPLSYAFSRTLSGVKTNTTYQGLFDRIKQEMLTLSPYQTPQIEGDASHQLFGGQAMSQPAYFMVNKVHSNQQVTIDGGEIMGLYPGSRLSFYNIDVNDTSLQLPKAHAIVSESNLFSSTLELDRPLSEKALFNSWVFIEERVFGKLQVSCKLSLDNYAALKQSLFSTLNDLPIVNIQEEHAELVIRTTADGQKIQLLSGPGYTLIEKNLSEINISSLQKTIKQKVEDYARGKYLRQMSFAEPSLRLDFEIIPVNASGNEISRAKVIPLSDKTGGENLVLKKGDHFKFRISNKGSRKAYFCLLDIQPDNVINVLIPYGRRSAEEFVIEPEKTKLLDGIFVIGEPYGRECFKLIATSTPLNLIRMVSTRGSSGISDNSHPLEVLLQSTYTADRSRGAVPVSVPHSSGHVSSLFFTISP